MYNVANYYDSVSLKLSDVLGDIGLNERLVLKRRKEMLLAETIRTVPESVFSDHTLYMFGSLSEGTTTLGLLSDTDILLCNHMINLMQEYSEWKQGYLNLLMIKDVNSSPGYCLLQVIRPDQPLPSKDVTTKNYVKVDKEIVLFKNLLGTDGIDGRVMHGPAWTTQRPGLRDYDTVMSFKCNSWPKEARQWLQEDDNMHWPSREIKKFAQNSGCFVVSTASRISQYKDLEWRISTSLAERSLMFSLNITQIRCYVLVKMVLKTYLNTQGESNLSSFMCKAVLMNCVKKTHPGFWVESNILTCFTYYLQRILFSILHDHCPHFIIPENNLMAGQFPAQIKHILLKKIEIHIARY
ncbi:uncharacterized protein LOC132719030 [Ruditapes philippinarum]|uniref:uncharacterized protein LOC132719030 n=1 Tax=Ruditapes philippinarum TaxID=129788 RepID=UPI00295AB4B4|nr:uncharacterized protein LOC132719030 [Ruditapes philippinarum]